MLLRVVAFVLFLFTCSLHVKDRRRVALGIRDTDSTLLACSFTIILW